MKKVILFLMTTLILSSCGGSDDNLQSGIIGKWNKAKETKEYSNGNTEEVILSTCDLKETLELKSNEQVILTKYSGANCEYSRVSEGVYSFNESNNELTLPGNNKQIVEVSGDSMNFKFTVTGVENYIKTVYFTRIN
ncbi:lipocalin family protein [Tenacibaculum soleae]|uniref:lipocalin family protein n=1 Tax=Tenacibaculum soleae TaxID=447689 RepID=UPI00230125BC|nr:lipocalin family protein [Tenacibaculum soleae]